MARASHFDNRKREREAQADSASDWKDLRPDLPLEDPEIKTGPDQPESHRPVSNPIPQSELDVQNDIRYILQALREDLRDIQTIRRLLQVWLSLWIILVVLGFIGGLVLCADTVSRPPMPPLY